MVQLKDNDMFIISYDESNEYFSKKEKLTNFINSLTNNNQYDTIKLIEI